jgi:hypothetical protein
MRSGKHASTPSSATGNTRLAYVPFFLSKALCAQLTSCDAFAQACGASSRSALAVRCVVLSYVVLCGDFAFVA